MRESRNDHLLASDGTLQLSFDSQSIADNALDRGRVHLVVIPVINVHVTNFNGSYGNENTEFQWCSIHVPIGTKGKFIGGETINFLRNMC